MAVFEAGAEDVTPIAILITSLFAPATKEKVAAETTIGAVMEDVSKRYIPL